MYVPSRGVRYQGEASPNPYLNAYDSGSGLLGNLRADLGCTSHLKAHLRRNTSIAPHPHPHPNALWEAQEANEAVPVAKDSSRQGYEERHCGGP